METKGIRGQVYWFDDLTGEGVIKDQYGRLYFVHYVHYSAIVSDDKWKTLKDKQKVLFKLIVDTTKKQVSRVVVMKEKVWVKKEPK